MSLFLRLRLIGAGLLLAVCPFAASASPPDTGWLSTPEHQAARVRLALPGSIDRQSGVADALLSVDLQKGWKTYWRSPGEGGIAPAIDWSNSRNLTQLDWQWPAPQRYRLQDIETAGYEGRIDFPLRLHWEDPRQPVQLRAKLTLPTCTTICVLTDFVIDLQFTPQQLVVNDALAHRFQQAMGKVPRPLPGASMTGARWDSARGILQLTLQREGGWSAPQVFPDAAGEHLADLNYQIESTEIDRDTLRVLITPSHWLELPKLVGERLRLTVVDGSFAAEYSAEITAGEVLPTDGNSLAWILLAALLGGLVLNIMPCVLPVLGLKLHGLVSHGHSDSGRIRRQFASSAAGMVFAFWLLGAGTLALQWSGQAVGWGMQFQNPWFVGLLVVVTFVFALNLAGILEWRLPTGLSTWAASRGGDGYLGHISHGMLATLLATPCTAPFLGTAVGFALGASPGMLLAIFTMLGLGMASPWLLVALFPASARLLPRPGPWLNWVKPLFALMMGATSLWLVGLLTPFTGATTVVLTIAAQLTLTVVLLGRRGGTRAAVAGIGAGCLVLAAMMVVGWSSGLWRASRLPTLTWQNLDATAIERAVLRGETVFVDITADWCITCQANKVGVLQREPVYSALQGDSLLRMRGDWTRPAPAITAFLKSNNSYGVPFNKVYGPGAPEGIDLPVLLTDEAVMAAIEAAGGQP